MPNGTSQEPFLNHDSKYESSFYGTGGQGVGSYDSTDPQHPGYPRFPPYDRLDIRTLQGVAGKAGYPAAPAHTGSSYSHPQSFQTSLNGQYPGDDHSSGKPGIPQEGSPASTMVSSHGTTVPGQHGGMVSAHFGSPASQLGSVVNGVQPQNIPIYPWMRPMNGGKLKS